MINRCFHFVGVLFLQFLQGRVFGTVLMERNREHADERTKDENRDEDSFHDYFP